ncbi:MAG: sigma factor-like helix-turn-helix DNA-binding protein [Ornithinimicrobium sp.]|uniref:sigma factor-like helix-turn-helix DNA-binding protein n=1 Tax=Ornithinimicrobium sp. TaxID=1977084 RepID=UPI003D9BFCB3
MPAPPAAAFRELVLSRSAALHRTALLLARDEQDARELLEEALARASRTWDRTEGQPEAYCRSMLARVATSVSRRRRHTGASSADSAGTPAEALRALPPRQRAVIVLLHFHHYTPEQTAEALDMRASAVQAEETVALDALGDRHLSGTGTLDAIADAARAPDATALLAGSVRRAEQIGRRRRLGWVGAAVAALALGGAGVVLDDSPDDPEQVEDTQDDQAPEDLAVPDPAYDEGYGFQDGTPRPFTLDGLQLVVSHEIAPGGLWSTGFPPTSSDDPLYAVAWCPSVDPDEVDSGSPVTMTAGDAVVLALPCTPTTDQQSVPVQPLPVDAGLWRVANPLSSGALVAVYKEATWEDFPFAPPGHRMAWSPPATTADRLVIDARSVQRPRPGLESVAGTAAPYSATVPTTTSTIDLDVILDGPGQVLVALDGVVVTEDGDGLGPAVGLGPLESAEPDLRRGFVHSFQPGVHRRTLRLDSDALSAMGVDLTDGEVEVSAVPRAVRPDAWAVQITTSGPTPAAETVLEPVPDETLPTYAFGLRQIGAVDVPADAQPRQVAVDPRGAGPLVWALDCSPEQPREDEPFVLTVGVTEHFLSCALGDAWSGAVRSSSDQADQPPPGRPTIAVDSAGPRDSVRVAAYEPVAWSDYPFESSTLAPDLQGLPEPGQSTSSGNDGLTNVYVETDVVTLADLDAQGQAVLQLEPAQFTDLVIRTTGIGRFRLGATEEGSVRAPVGPSDLRQLPYGDVLERNGWWSSWTAAPSTWLVPALSREDDRPVQELGGELTVTVEGYEGGSLEIAAISLLPALGD